MNWLLTFLGFGFIILIMKLNKIGYGSSRGYDYKISNDCIIREKNVRLFYENGDEDGDCERGVDLNRIEEDIVFGDYGFMDNGFDNCLNRLEKVLKGECIRIEREEECFVIGEDIGKCYMEIGKMELEWRE